MNAAAANALMVALEGVRMPASAVMAFPSPTTEVWSVQLDPTHVYNGDQLAQLAAYCSSHGLVLSAQFTALGIT